MAVVLLTAVVVLVVLQLPVAETDCSAGVK